MNVCSLLRESDYHIPHIAHPESFFPEITHDFQHHLALQTRKRAIESATMKNSLQRMMPMRMVKFSLFTVGTSSHDMSHLRTMIAFGQSPFMPVGLGTFLEALVDVEGVYQKGRHHAV
jgi:hypothetical protein